MGGSQTQAIRWTLVAALGLALVGCSSLTTRIAGWYITREIDSYLDLDGDQHDRVRAMVDDVLVEVRRDALPRWIGLFREARDTLDKGASEARLRALQSSFDALMDQAVDVLAPRFGIILADLNEQQIAHFEQQMLEKLDDTYPEQLEPEDERRELLDERLIDDIEDYVGDLSDSQQRTILAKVHTLPDERPVQYRVGKQRIHAGCDFLRAHPSSAEVEAELKRLWDTRYQVLGPGRDKEARRAEQREVLLTIDGTLTRDQRDHGVDEINNLIRKTKRFLLTEG